MQKCVKLLQVFTKGCDAHMRWYFLEGQKRYMLPNCKGNTFFGIYRSHDTQKEAHDTAQNLCLRREKYFCMIDKCMMYDDKRFCKSHNNIGPETDMEMYIKTSRLK